MVEPTKKAAPRKTPVVETVETPMPVLTNVLTVWDTKNHRHEFKQVHWVTDPTGNLVVIRPDGSIRGVFASGAWKRLLCA